MLHFWLSCIVKAILDTVSFMGTNVTGILYAIAIAIVPLVSKIKKRISVKGGWRNMKGRDWLSVFREAGNLSLKAGGIVFFCYLFAAPYGLLTEEKVRAKEASALLATDRAGVVRDRDGLRTKLEETNRLCAVTDGAKQTLEKQNRDQQLSINGCLSQAMKLLTPAPEIFTPVAFEVNQSGTAITKSRWLVFINRTISTTAMTVTCDQDIENMTAKIVGDNSTVGGTARMSNRSWDMRLTSPVWGPTSPVLTDIASRGQGALVCSFNKR